MKLAPQISQIRTTRRDNAFLVEDGDGLTLIDVGWARAPKTLLNAVADLGLKPSDIRRLVLTHAHPDHVRGAAELRRQTGAAILIHRADADWLQAGRVPADGRSGALGRLLDRLPPLHWAPVEPDALLEDGDLIADTGLRVIHTPGHTPGHIVLHHEPSHTLLMGDAAFNRGDTPSLGPAALAADPAARPASLAKLPADPAAVGFAHGIALTGAATTAYQRLLEQSLTSDRQTGDDHDA
jgi:glyoxylase-like metal-dependent hydrolase (beta-lactamase superfamily II)